MKEWQGRKEEAGRREGCRSTLIYQAHSPALGLLRAAWQAKDLALTLSSHMPSIVLGMMT